MRCKIGVSGDQPGAAAAGEEAERPAGEDEEPVLEPDQVEEVDEEPGDPRDEAPECVATALASTQVENELERVVERPHLFRRQLANPFAQGTRIDGADHLAHDPRPIAADDDLGMEARGRSRRRGRADEDRGQREEVACLRDHRKAAPVLHVAPPPRKCDRVNVTANHEAAP